MIYGINRLIKMAVSDDDIIKRKLLLEGDGGNDDRRISSLLKTFLKWSNSATDEEDINASYQRMIATVHQCEYAMQKSYNVYTMNKLEQESYQRLNKQIEQKIEGAVEKISDCKNELLQAKRVRKNRQEYDALAKVIQQHPDRQDTLKKLEYLDKELAEMTETKESLEQKLNLRRKQFHVLIAAIHEMQRILEEDEQRDEKDSDDKNNSMDTT